MARDDHFDGVFKERFQPFFSHARPLASDAAYAEFLEREFEPFLRNLGTNIRVHRDSLGITVEEMAGLLRTAVSILEAVEDGRLETTLCAVLLIARKLRIPVSALFDRAKIVTPGNLT
ncbi:MAG: helix-turn-helix domain-containing protein [Sphingomonadales bacterium]